MDRDSIRSLERIHGLLARSFLRYAVEGAGPSALDPWDEKALAALTDWNRSLLRSLEGIEEVLAEEKVHPPLASWPVEFSTYNYLGGAYVLRVAIRLMGPVIGLAEAEAAGLAGWPAAARAAGRALEEARSHLAALAAFEAGRPKTAPVPGVKKGVSASRW